MSAVKACPIPLQLSGRPPSTAAAISAAQPIKSFVEEDAPFRPIADASRFPFQRASSFRHAHSKPCRAQLTAHVRCRGNAGRQSGWLSEACCWGGEEGPEASGKPRWGPCWRGEIKSSSGEERDIPGGAGGRGPAGTAGALAWIPVVAKGNGPAARVRALSPGSGRLQGSPPTILQMEKLRPGVGARGCTTYEAAAFGGGFTSPHNLILSLSYSKIHPGLLGVFPTRQLFATSTCCLYSCLFSLKIVWLIFL